MKKLYFSIMTLALSASMAVAQSDVQTVTTNGVSFKMIKVDGGTFTMGSDADDADMDEKPAHQVTLSSYYIGETEVTQELWTAVMGSNPSKIVGENLPVNYVCWDDCHEFIAKLNELTGKEFALPTEAQWEFAALGGNLSEGYTYSGSNDVNAVAWYKDNSGNTMHAVATKAPNELGIYDMSGNAYEWCEDWYATTYPSEAQVDPTGPTGPAYGQNICNRNGAYSGSAYSVRVKHRQFAEHDDAVRTFGIRLAAKASDVTGISTVTAEAQKAATGKFNIAGQRVDGTYKGIIIENGEMHLTR